MATLSVLPIPEALFNSKYYVSIIGIGVSTIGIGISIIGFGVSIIGFGISINGFGVSINGFGISIIGFGISINGFCVSIIGIGVSAIFYPKERNLEFSIYRLDRKRLYHINYKDIEPNGMGYKS